MHIAALSPLAIDEKGLDPGILKKEKKIITEELKNSGKDPKIAEKISSTNIENLCILVSPSYSIKPFLDQTKFNCIDKWQLIDTNYQRPFLAVQHVRNIKKGMPYKCKTIHEEDFKLLFIKKKFVTGRLLKCY